MLFYAKKGEKKKHHQFNDSYYIHIHASSCKVVGQMEFEMCLASLPVWRKTVFCLMTLNASKFPPGTTMSQSQLNSRRTSRCDWRATLKAGCLRKNTQQCVINIIQLFGWLLFAIVSDPLDESPRSSTSLTSNRRSTPVGVWTQRLESHAKSMAGYRAPVQVRCSGTTWTSCTHTDATALNFTLHVLATWLHWLAHWLAHTERRDRPCFQPFICLRFEKKLNKTNAANIVFPPRGHFKPPLPAAKLFVLYLRSEISLVS